MSDTSILHHVFMLIFIAFWAVISLQIQYLCLFSLILQGLHEEGECRQLEFWPENGAKLTYLFYATPNAVKINEDFFPDLSKILGRRSARGAPAGGHKPARRGHGVGRASQACGLPVAPLWYFFRPVFFIKSKIIPC